MRVCRLIDIAGPEVKRPNIVEASRRRRTWFPMFSPRSTRAAHVRRAWRAMLARRMRRWSRIHSGLWRRCTQDGGWPMRPPRPGSISLLQCCLVLRQEPTVVLLHHIGRILDRVARLLVRARLLENVGR